MITSIELENVRIFEGKGWSFPLHLMTVLCGTNSAGKSTILKALLLLQQSQSIRGNYGVIEGKLRLVGDQVDLGSYSSFVSGNITQKKVSLSVTIEDDIPISYCESFLKINPKRINESDDSDNEENKHVKYTMKSSFTFGLVKGDMNRTDSKLKAIENNDGSASFSPQAVLKESNYELYIGGDKLLCWSVVRTEDFGFNNQTNYEIRLPTKFFDSCGGARFLVPKSRNKKHVRLSVAHPGIIPSNIFAQEKLKDSDSNESEIMKGSQWLLAGLPPIIREVMDDLNTSLNDIYYIGPLRSSPQRHYLSYSEYAPKIDPTGEALPYILREKAIYGSGVWNIPPFSNDKPLQEPLSKALNAWLYYLRVGDKPPQDVKDAEIEVRTTSDLVVELRIRSATSEKCYSLADSGFGYSQLLPIVVKGLLAEPGSMLLVEQPELHLNPALQVRLATFLMAMVGAGKQILIETHSEHIVNAIRVITAEDESGNLEDKSNVFFIDTVSNRPYVHELSIQQDGTIPDFPAHFFGEAISLSGRLFRAQKNKRIMKKVK
jgi:predicted ATPase